ncbi:hypothetical protein MKEN_01240400 [Mycena kentingensis (nom. inval.)]|nr:hypothetical protein MKEN_01240400 [Mycena kentingensis (nom. inval.)]
MRSRDGWRYASPRVPRPLASVVSAIFSLLAQTAFITLPICLLWRVHTSSWSRWLQEYQQDIFWPAFPLLRIRLVLLMSDIPRWGLYMALAVPLWTLVRRRLTSKPANDSGLPLDEVGSRSERSVPSKHAFLGPFAKKCLYAYTGLVAGGAFLYSTREYAADYRYRAVVQTAIQTPRNAGYGDGTKVFIAAMFYNNAAILPYWTREFTKLIHYLGPDNVFVSVVESNSSDGTAELLDDWQATLDQLGVQHLIRTRDTTIKRPADMSTATPRIQFLAETRNLVLAPLIERDGYDIVLFSNDVLVEADAVVELLKTNNGEWDMVCGLDLHRWGLYDAWVVRDRLGALVSSLWPYLLDPVGRQAVINDEPAPVFTCWNGIVAFSANPFLPPALRTPGRLSTSPLRNPLPSTHPAYPQPADLSPAQTPALRFRHSTEKECFSAEAFNLPYDLRRQFDMQRIYLNPRVINSYERKWYEWYKYKTRHWLVRWWMRYVERGRGMEEARMILGDADKVWRWDGGECHPWW